MARPGPALLLLLVLVAVGCGGRGPARGGMLVPEEAVGMQRGTFALLDARLREEELRRRIPGGVLAVSSSGRLVYQRTFGSGSPELLYDTASLTKPLLAPAAWELLASSSVGHRALASAVLGHRTGWNDEEHYASLLASMLAAPAGEWEVVLADWLAGAPESPSNVYQYSNTAHALLSTVLAREVPGARGRLEAWLAELPGSEGIVLAPAGMAAAPSGRRADGSLIRGRPFDGLADVMTGRHDVVALHSGVFARADSLARVFGWILTSDEERAGAARALLFEGVERRSDAVTGGMVHASGGGLRSPVGLPWAPEGSTPGRYFVQTGYTGCLLWVDAERKVVVVLLTNASLAGEQAAWEDLSHEVVRAVLGGTPRAAPRQ